MAQRTMTQDPLLQSGPVSGQRAMQLLTRGATYLIILALCVLFGFPFFWTVMSSLKTIPSPNGATTGPFLISTIR